jgi:competence protein ComEC
MTVHFYDVGEGLAALVDLPDGRHVLVDTGAGDRRAACGEACETANRHLMAMLRADLRGAPIDLVWITHQHADHIGGATEVMQSFSARFYVDNGRDTRKPEVRRARLAAANRGTTLRTVDPEHTEMPIADSSGVSLSAVVPPAWPASCQRDPNECSIALRLDYCASSVIFTGDAEHEEEALLDPRGTVTLLQVAHHGSETSTSPAFLAKTRPRYAVISAGKPNEGNNRAFCHPRALVVARLTRALALAFQDRSSVFPDAPAKPRSLVAFDGERCDRAVPSDWVSVAASDRLFATSRDGDVVLTTDGDGTFSTSPPP